MSNTTLRGLSHSEAAAKLAEHGPNALPEKLPPGLHQRFLAQFKSPLIGILLFALVVDLAVWVFEEAAAGFPIESIAIVLILLANAALGVFQETKAEAALAGLKGLAKSTVLAIRDGHAVHLHTHDIVPGDLIRLEAGDRLPADVRLLDPQGVSVDESILTGESVPVEKADGDEGFGGTLIARGKSYAEVTRTGPGSALGRLAQMIGQIEEERTPLEKRMHVFGNQIARWVILLALSIAVVGLIVEGPGQIGHVLLFTVALAVSAVPEGLPAVLTLTLSIGVQRMARRKAVVRRLSAVEALGSVTVIATDKTGTLTENRMEVRSLDTPHHGRCLRAMTLANDADLEAEAGDPLEVALLRYVAQSGEQPDVIRRSAARVSVLPFDSANRFMRVTVEEDGATVSYLKGAPEAMLERSQMTPEQRSNWAEKTEGYAAEGFRVLALGVADGEIDEGLEFLGLALLWDPPRSEVPEAIHIAQEAGIRVLMVTGDHPSTALAVADEVGIRPGRVVTGIDLETLDEEELGRAVEESSVFARVAPEQKLQLVEALQNGGEIVAVTGDGVNDAPALKKSDVGVSMGIRGSDVAREVSDLVLIDDNFGTIVAAIEGGRDIYENIRKFIRFLFSTNLSEILIILGGLIGSFFLGLQDDQGRLLLPLTPVQILWLNILTDGPVALALGLDRNGDVMSRRPRDPAAPLLDAETIRFIALIGSAKALIGGCLLVGMPAFGQSHDAARSALFLFMAGGQLMLSYPARRFGATAGPNPALHGAVALSVLMLALAALVPMLRSALGLTTLDAPAALWAGLGVLLIWAFAEIVVQSHAKRTFPHTTHRDAARPEPGKPSNR